ncbi:hypothetical protein D3C72_2087120 [compost metagenome]
MTIGAGYYKEATIGSIAVFLMLIVFKYIQNIIDRISMRYTYEITLPFDEGALAKYEEIFRQHHLKAKRGKQIRRCGKYTIIWYVQGTTQNHENCAKLLFNDLTIDEFKF